MSRGGTGSPQSVTQVSTNIPEYARPFYEEMLGRTVYESARPYEAYPGARIQDFTPQEIAGMAGVEEMSVAGAPKAITSAERIAQGVGDFVPSGGRDVAAGFTPGDITSQYAAGTFDPAYTAGDLAADYTGPGYSAGTFDPGYQAADLARSYAGPVFRAGTSTDPATIQDYMNPYQQLVTDVQKREARRASDVQAVNIGQQAAQAGGLGGYREALLESERERNLGQQLQDIQATGDQAAYQQAVQAFERDRGARLKEAQFGAAMRDQDIQAFRAGEGARQEAARMGMTAQQQEEAARLREAQFGTSIRDQNIRAFQIGENARQQAARMGLTAQQQEDAANQAQERFRTQAEQFNIRADETQARLGLAGLGEDRAARQQQLDAARVLGTFGGQQQRMAYDRWRNLQAVGEIQRQLGQRSMDMGYQDFLRQQAYPREQLAFYSSMLRGLPVTPGQTTATYGGPSRTQQMLGAGIGGVGLYRALGGLG
jgi:hypothetical protein